MNLNAPEVAPLANWCITALMCGREVCHFDVPKHLACSEDVFEAVMEEIVNLINNSQPATVH